MKLQKIIVWVCFVIWLTFLLIDYAWIDNIRNPLIENGEIFYTESFGPLSFFHQTFFILAILSTLGLGITLFLSKKK